MIISDCRPGRRVSPVDKDGRLIRMPGKTGIKRPIILLQALNLRVYFLTETGWSPKREMMPPLRS
jgi:hypothetical protein